VEERSLALEARAFSATTPKTSLFDVPDPPAERLLRWAILIVAVAIIAFRLAQAFR
jgi:energy-coupling factor transport system permease protein